ncbi:MAG: hypothetical protein WC928_03490 [Patescibacteria group bacterium]|jgi:hypothetical protein
MKKLFLILVFMAVAVSFRLIFGDDFEKSTRQKIDNNKSKVETETIEFERSKDFSLIKVIDIIDIIDTMLAVDAFGNKLKLNEWYVQSNITRVVFPINTKSTNHTKLAWLMAKGKKELTRMTITNGRPLGIYVNAEILLLGEEILILNDLEQYQVISIK